MAMKNHVMDIGENANLNLRNLLKIPKILNKNTVKTTVNTLVTGHQGYDNR